MVFRVLADLTVVVHVAFVVFVMLGGVLAVRWPRMALAHLPAVAWGAWVEFAGRVCPLTPLENALRTRGGGVAYSASFVEHYLVPVLYPGFLSREIQFALGAFVLLLNGFIYAVVLRRRIGARRLNVR